MAVPERKAIADASAAPKGQGKTTVTEATWS
jgi:hypothetical protein